MRRLLSAACLAAAALVAAPAAMGQKVASAELVSQATADWALGKWAFNWKNVEGGGSLTVWQSSYFGEAIVERNAAGEMRATVTVRETGDSTEFVKWSGPVSISGNVVLIEGDTMIEESYVGDVKPGLLELTRHETKVTARIVPALWFGLIGMGGGAQNIDVFR